MAHCVVGAVADRAARVRIYTTIINDIRGRLRRGRLAGTLDGAAPAPALARALRVLLPGRARRLPRLPRAHHLSAGARAPRVAPTTVAGAAQAAQFVRDGFVTVEGLVGEAQLEAWREQFWGVIGADRHDASTWPG